MPAFTPGLVGLKTTLMVQVPPTGRVAPRPAEKQVLVTMVNSVAPGAMMVLLMVTGPLPMFLTVMVCAGLSCRPARCRSRGWRAISRFGVMPTP
ncbi:MAG: hypothetical protein U0841_09740 [Chloroflexia bacterium]